MIRIKHFLDLPESTDGKRVWVDPPGLTRDLREWCRVDYVLPELGPPADVSEWFVRHPSKYRAFRAQYRGHLLTRGRVPALLRLGHLATSQTVTLLHQCDHESQNTAAALRDIVGKLCAPRSDDRRNGLRQPGPCRPAKATQHASPAMPKMVARAASAPGEAASAIYRWQIVTDEPPVTHAGHQHRKSFRHFLVGCVRRVKRCAHLIRLARRRNG